MNMWVARATAVLTAAVVAVAVLIGSALAARAATAAIPAPKFVVPAMVDSTGTLPQELAVGDFDGNGTTDVALSNQGPAGVFHGGIAAALGNGAGGFGSVVTSNLPNDWGACDLVASDFDGDGLTDLATEGCTTGGSGTLFLLRATGTGEFTVAQSISNATDLQLGTADVNGDGDADLVSAAGSKVKVYLGVGNGTVGTPASYNNTFGSFDIATADLNADGHSDIVGASGGAPWSMLNQGNGTFGAQIQSFDPAMFGIKLAVADFDGDGTPDIAQADASGGHVNVGLGLGDGHFASKQVVSAVSSQTNWITAADFTGDSRIDLIADGDSNTVVLLKGRGDGTFGRITRWVTGSEGVTAADLDGSGPADLASYSSDPGRLYGAVARGRGFFAPPVTITSVFGLPDSADVNGDGRRDLVRPGARVQPGTIQSVVVTHLGDGHGGFGKPIVSVIRMETASSGPTQLRLADVNEDGLPDAVGGFNNVLPSPHNLFSMLSNGDGTFGAPSLLSSGDTNADVDALDVADVTGDGHLDIVSNTTGTLSVKPGHGDGTFGAPMFSGRGSSGSKPQVGTHVADFTLDGIPDVLAVIVTGTENIAGSDVVLQQGNGDGTFFVLQTLHIDSNAGQSDVADLNGDTRPDVAVEGTAGFDFGLNGLFVFIDATEGTLGDADYVPRGFGSLAISDVNLDGAPDILTDGISGILVNLNDGGASFTQTVELPAGGGPSLAADFTEDGRPDLISDLNTFPASFGFYRNRT